MNLSTRLNDPTFCFLVAFDIVSSSQNLANPSGLARDRELLFDAIDQTKLVREKNHSIVGQFLGDEFRLAIPAAHDGKLVVPSEIVEFIDEVFRKLNSPNLGYAPVIRAAVFTGTLRSLELNNFCYLSGEIALQELSRLLNAADGVGNLLISNKQLPGLLEESSKLETYYVKRYQGRPTPVPYPGPAIHNLPSYFLVALTNIRQIVDDAGITTEIRDVDPSLLNFVRLCLDGFNPVRITISPSSIVFIFSEASFKESKRFLANVRDKAVVYIKAVRLAAAIAYGPGQVIQEKNWLAQTFESGTAIQLCRLLAKLPPGSLAMPDDRDYAILFSPLSQSLNEQLSLHGKRQEVFNCRIDRDYFPKEVLPDSDRKPQDVFKCRIDRDYFPKEDRPDSDRKPPVSPQPPDEPLQPVVHQKPVIIPEQKDSPRPQNMPLTDQDWMVIDDIFSRIPSFSDHSRNAFLIRIAKTPAQRNAVETKLAVILGHQDFYVALKNFVRLSQQDDEELEQRTLESLTNYVVNQKDSVILERLIKDSFAQPVQTPQNSKPELESTPVTEPVKARLKKQCQAMFIAKQWPELLDLLDQSTKQMGGTKRATNLQDVVVVFRSDYESIRRDARNGLISTGEEKRLLVSLWSRVLMLVDDIEGNLKI